MPSRSKLSFVLGRLAVELHALLTASAHHAPGQAMPWRRLLLLLFAAGSCYGAVMGSYAGFAGALYAALKVPLLLILSPLLCLPSFRVVHSVLGLADDEPAARQALLSAQATMAVSLASLAPIVAFCYVSSDHYQLAKLANGLAFALSSFAAQLTLTRHYRPLLQRNRRHLIALALWPGLYIFVALQLAYALRPFVGNPNFETSFLRADWLGNVYLDLYWAVRGVLG